MSLYNAGQYARAHKKRTWKSQPDRRRLASIREWVRENPYVEGGSYTSEQLEAYADLLIINGGDPTSHGILLDEHMAHRLKREIYVTDGFPDAALMQGMYWRTHPKGRPFSTKEERKGTKLSFYK